MNIKKITITNEDGEVVYVAYMDISNYSEILRGYVADTILEYGLSRGMKLTIEIV